ncbi:globin family protein [uncultured Kiloniella sp.]|uniref:globin family protein n=1 Tax=uncultured Kiloniella sp. TaxID=1133091 RepID=UPI002638F932|nr:globin family protein [uncultured Kiloniella sp.]
MTPKQVALVQKTFKSVAAISEQAAELFYGRLFELDPSLKRLFKGDMKEQGRKLMAVIGVAVASLNNLEKIIPTVQKLGAKHAGYGVKEADYATVANALLWTLEKGLGPDFTAEVKVAWTETYQTLASVMIEASKNHEFDGVFLEFLAQAYQKIPELEKRQNLEA